MRNKKAISPILATLLLIVIVIACAVVVYAYVLGYVNILFGSVESETLAFKSGYELSFQYIMFLDFGSIEPYAEIYVLGAKFRDITLLQYQITEGIDEEKTVTPITNFETPIFIKQTKEKVFYVSFNWQHQTYYHFYFYSKFERFLIGCVSP